MRLARALGHQHVLSPGCAVLCCAGKTKVAHIQRSCGYALRPTLSVEEIERAVQIIKAQVIPVTAAAPGCKPPSARGLDVGCAALGLGQAKDGGAVTCKPCTSTCGRQSSVEQGRAACVERGASRCHSPHAVPGCWLQDPACIVTVDNCYGEFTEDREPCAGGCRGSELPAVPAGWVASGARAWPADHRSQATPRVCCVVAGPPRPSPPPPQKKTLALACPSQPACCTAVCAAAGADLAMGSLIKNGGGTLAPGGGVRGWAGPGTDAWCCRAHHHGASQCGSCRMTHHC